MATVFPLGMNPKAAVALTLFGVLGVFLAAFVVKSMDLEVLKWVVLGVVLYTSTMMFVWAHRSQPAAGAART